MKERRKKLVGAADWGPRVLAEGWGEALEVEPGAGLVGGDLEGDTFAEDVDGKLEVFGAGRTESKRRLRCRRGWRVGVGSEEQVPCPFDVEGEVGEKFAVGAKTEGAFDAAFGEIVRGV